MLKAVCTSGRTITIRNKYPRFVGSAAYIYTHGPSDERLAVKIARYCLDHEERKSMTAMEKRRYVRKSFCNEIKVLPRLSHENIVKYHGHGWVKASLLRRPFIALEYIEGGSVSSRLISGQRFTPPQAMRVVYDIARGLAYMHDLELVHADVKHGNHLIDPKRDRAVLADFALASPAGKCFDSYYVRSGKDYGTPYYQSLERLRRGVPQKWDDISALGICCYEMLANREVFDEGASSVDVEVRALVGKKIAGLVEEKGIGWRLMRLMLLMTGTLPGGGFREGRPFRHAGQLVEHIRQTPELSSLLTHRPEFSMREGKL